MGFGSKHDSDGESTDVREYTSPVSRNDVLICATHGKIYAVHKHSGARIWRADFPKGSSSIFSVGSMGSVVSIFITDQDDLIICSSGKTASLNLYTGAVNWVNKMKGFGHEEVSIVCTPGQAFNSQHSNYNNPRYSAPEYNAPEAYNNPGFINPEYNNNYPGYNNQGHCDPGYNNGGYRPPPGYPQRSVAVVGSGGNIMGIDVRSGEELWRFDCPKGGYKIPSILVDPQGTIVYVGCGTRLYCLEAMTGQLQWQVRVSKSHSGLDYMTMATPWSSRLTAEVHTSFNTSPSAQIMSTERTAAYADAGASVAGAGA
ncbi:quinon protein alcohol dehydrogenase-like superfamily [Zychaea mexicana]|uniref:quinon protein alcohol dehydrogenase-like superfamily n=1 Tax=Zychaea mexicana TaxID=64656 RepID=UPI0022FDCBA0|nr:quinon protein alcohol dehydrogenase-like superfamily [Zychaea mexicana]KAI9496582.1 quinon protein alcohol dehydrogenase-like superfamily [Zychaea mexicana]